MRNVVLVLLLFSGCTEEYFSDRDYPRFYPLAGSRASSTTANLSVEIFYSSVPILDHGFVYSDAGFPTLADGTIVSLGPKDGAGVYSHMLTGLLPSSQYRVRAYAISEGHTVYSTTLLF